MTTLEDNNSHATYQDVQFGALLEAAPIAIVAIKKDGQIVTVNDKTMEIFGYDRRDLLGQHVEILLPNRLKHNHVGHRTDFFANPRARAMGAGYDLWGQRKDGTEFPLEVGLTVVEVDGEKLAVAFITDISERKRLEEQRQREVEQQQLIEAQKAALQELSTPIIPIMDRIIIVPLIGTIDTARSRDIMRALLAGITEYRAQVAIIDITGVPIVDTGVADHLNRTIQAARLKGAQTIVTGVSDAVAETIVDLGIDWSSIETLRDLQTGLLMALNRLGSRIERRSDEQ